MHSIHVDIHNLHILVNESIYVDDGHNYVQLYVCVIGLYSKYVSVR
jgi:hypothetical protein